MGRTLAGTPVGNQMDQLKRTALSVLIAVMVFLAGMTGLCGFYAEAKELRALFDTPVYADSDLNGTPLGELKAGDTVKVEEEGERWIKIAYGEGSAYVSSQALYESPIGELFVYERARVTATAKKKLIFLYDSPDHTKNSIRKLSDGKAVIKCGEAGDYYYVIVDGEEQGYVLKEHITTGLSYNQRIAAVIVTVLVGTALIIGLLIYFRRKMPQRKK